MSKTAICDRRATDDDAGESRSARNSARAALWAALASLPEALVLHDREGRIIDANHQACARLGAARDEVLDSTLRDLLDSEETTGATRPWRCLAPGGAVTIETRVALRRGGGAAIQLHCTRLQLPGPPCFVSYLRDGRSSRPAAPAQRSTEQQLEVFLDQSPSVCFQKSAAGRYELINRRYAELFHVDREAVVGKTDYDVFPAEVAERLRENDALVVQSGHVLIAEETVPQDDGPHSYLSYKFPIRDAAGRVVSVAGIATDTTERKQAEERLRVRERQLAAFFANNPAACFQKDTAGRYQLVNQECADVFGMDATGCIGKTDLELFTAETAEAFRASDREAIESGRVVVTEHTVPTAKGPREYLVSKAPIRDGAGQTVGIAGFATDITEGKRAEAALRASERRYRGLAELAPDAVLIVRGDLIALANSAAARLFGASGPDALIGKKFGGIFSAHDRARILRRHRQLLEADTAAPFLQEVTLGPEGSGKVAEVAAARFDDDEGAAVHVIVRDLTERRRLEEALIEATEQERRRFGADLHDDLGQWLTGAAMMLRAHEQALHRAGLESAGEIREIGGVLLAALERARLLARGFAPDLERAGLAPALKALAAGCSERFQLACAFRGKPGAGDELPTAVATHLYRIAQEATTNAARHANARSIRIDLDRRGGELILRISDDGIGIPEVTAGGSEGMGIRSMRYRARLVGGTLEVAAGPARGTVVECRCLARHAAPSRLRSVASRS